MSNDRYFEVCPRGFSNETSYIRVRPDQVTDVEKYFEDYISKAFDDGRTSASCGWTDSPRARETWAALSWDDYRAEYVFDDI